MSSENIAWRISVGAAGDRLLDEAALPALADAAARAQPDLGLAAASSGVGRRSVTRATRFELVVGGRERAARAGRPRSTATITTAMTAMPDRRPTRGSRASGAVVAEAVAVEQRVVPEAGVVAKPVGTASRWYFFRSRSSGASSPKAPPGASSPSGVEHDHRAEADQRPAPAEPAGGAESASVSGDAAVVDAQDRQVGPLQVGDHAGGEHDLDDAGDREVGERHRRDRLARDGTARTAACRWPSGTASAARRTRSRRTARRR